MLSSRKQANVERAVAELRKEEGAGAEVEGVVCHVGKAEHRARLIQQVSRAARAGGEGERVTPSPRRCQSLEGWIFLSPMLQSTQAFARLSRYGSVCKHVWRVVV